MLRRLVLLAALSAVFSLSSGKAPALSEQQAGQIFTDTSEALGSQAAPAVKPIWAKELPANKHYEVVVLDTTEPQVRIALAATRPVHDLTLLGLEFLDISDEGKPNFKTQVLHTYAELKPEHPLIIVMTFYGSIPGYGFSYRDADGTVRNFAVQESGKDGSLELVSF